MRHFLTISLIVMAIMLSASYGASIASANALDTTTGSFDTTSTGNNDQTQSTGNTTGTKLINPLQSGASLESFLISILNFVIRIGTIVIILMLVYVGYLFVVAQGSDSKLSEAKHALLWTLVGALILLGSKAIALAIQATVQAL